MKTPQQLRDLADAIEAHERGEPVESINPNCNGDKWTVIVPQFENHLLYRPAPKPVTRPWCCSSEARIGAEFDGGKQNHKGCSRQLPSIITCIENSGFRVARGGRNELINFSNLDGTEHWRQPFTEEWLPCVVTEPQP